MSKRSLEKKYREDEEATAYAFQEFIQTFQNHSGPPNKLFVKSGILNAKTGEEEQHEKGKMYISKPLFRQDSNTIKNAVECATLVKDKIEKLKGQEKPKTNLELLKEELKLRHMERDERNKHKDEINFSIYLDLFEGSDPTSTNLFVANIIPKITEQDLMKLFGAYGPLASVKIMWPRGEERNRSSNNCGFVAFMSRKDGERALLNLKDHDGMQIGWGKPVEIPPHPVYIPPELLKLSLPPPPTGLPFNAQPSKQPFQFPTTDEEMKNLLSNSIVKVTIPLDKKILMTVHRMIEFVAREGPLFEAMIMNKEINNPNFSFLFDYKHPNHIYYRWKLFSIIQSGSQKNWSTKEFRMFKDGPIWMPPIIPNYTQGMPDHLVNASMKIDRNLLSETQKERLITSIQHLTTTRSKIGEAMIFCLNHSDAVKDAVDIIVDSFNNISTKPVKKIARLYFISDIVYNSYIRKSNITFHIEFKEHLSNIFEQLKKAFNNLQTIGDKDAFKYRVTKVLRSWDLWKIYPTEYLNKLESIFLGTFLEIEKLDEDSGTDEPLDGANLIKRSLKNNTEYLIKDEITENETNEIKRNLQSKTQYLLSGFIPSKWETVDPEQVEAQAMSTKKFYDLELERKSKEQELDNRKKCDKNRDMLRKVEVMVMQYQDELESGKRKCKRGTNIDKELDDYRTHMLKKFKRQEEHQHSSPTSSDNISSDDCDKRGSLKRNKRYKKKNCYKNRDKRKYSH